MPRPTHRSPTCDARLEFLGDFRLNCTAFLNESPLPEEYLFPGV